MDHFHIVDRATAQSVGLPRYFTGMPCIRGGFAERSTNNHRCLCEKCKRARADGAIAERARNPQAAKEKDRKYLEKNREKINARNRENKAKNKDKIKAKRRAYYLTNIEKLRSQWRASYLRRQEKALAYAREYRANNPDYAREYAARNRDATRAKGRKWQVNNPDKVRAHVLNRIALRKGRMPVWFSELDQFVIEEAYCLARERKKATGIRWEVDHLIPLLCKVASGLHCADNIQVIPRYLNRRKCNKLIISKPDEWLAWLTRP